MSSSSIHSSFLSLSEVLTGFTAFKLQGTGQVSRYYETVKRVVGEQILGELLETFVYLEQEGLSPEDFDQRFRADILSDEKLGPVARHLIKLWFIGTWFKLPEAWHEHYGNGAEDEDVVPHPSSYVEGLLWPAIEAHPPGAKAPGYGTWTEAPEIPDLPST